MCDDWGLGAVDTTFSSVILANLCAQASANVDAMLSSIYQTPFSNPPALVKSAAITFAAEMLYLRRLTPTESNPFKSQADMYRDMLKKIGNGDIPLDANTTRIFSPIIARTHPSRVDSNIF